MIGKIGTARFPGTLALESRTASMIRQLDTFLRISCAAAHFLVPSQSVVEPGC